MLKKTEIKRIVALRDHNTYERIERLSFNRAFEGAADYDEKGISRDLFEIEEIILKYINIQHALSIYAVKIPETMTYREAESLIDDMETVNLLTGVPEKEQLIALRRIFKNVALYKDEDGRTIEIKVVNPSEMALNVFRRLKREMALNKWLVSIMYPYVNDVRKVEAYQVEPAFDHEISEAEFGEIMYEFANDPFVKYLLEGEKNRTIKRQVKIGGSIEELDRNRFLVLFSFLVDSLFVYIEKEKNESGKKQFNKYFTWFEKDEDQSRYSPEDFVGLLNAVMFLTNARIPTIAPGGGRRIRFVTEEEAKILEEKEAERIAKLLE